MLDFSTLGVSREIGFETKLDIGCYGVLSAFLWFVENVIRHRRYTCSAGLDAIVASSALGRVCQ